MTAAVLERRPLTGPALGLVGAAAYAAGNLAVDPFATHKVATHEVGCPFLAITGLWCPGCGSSRAANLVLHGDLAGSFQYHPFVVPVIVLFAYLWVGWWLRSRGSPRSGRWRRPSELPRMIPFALAAAFVVLWVLRNVPGFAFLAPPT